MPAVVGAVGVIYDALQAHTPTTSSNSSSDHRRMDEWAKHVQTGRLVAVAVLATGALVARFKGVRKSR
jgi:hypothetical protein